MAEPGMVLVRHGETEWSRAGRHTGRTDVPLLPEGREQAAALAPVLAPMQFARVLCSPRSRAQETCRLAGLGDRMQILDDLVEWDYGAYEGITSAQIHEQRPDWSLWRDGCPDGESPQQVSDRADRVIAAALAGISSDHGDVILFAHGHILRVVGARWMGFLVDAGSRLILSPATISRLGHEHAIRAIERWNSPAGA
jgi:broad specificity phosphatase PhoE